MSTISNLCAAWIKAKDEELIAKELRREIENQLIQYPLIQCDGFQVDILTRGFHIVDVPRFHWLAMENGLGEHVSSLIRMRAELNLKVWQATSPAITDPLRPAIRVETDRPSFKITKMKKDLS